MCCIATEANDCLAGGGRLKDRCIVLVPALNEEATISSVIADLRTHGFRRVRVIDNGSSDDTAASARLSGAEVISEPRRGYGRACWTGLQNLPSGVEWVLFCDADGSSDLRDLERMVSAATETDLVFGERRTNRTNRPAMTAAQRFGNALATTLIRLSWGHRYADLGPLRLVRTEALERIAMRDRGFGSTVEMQVRAVELGLRVREVPVRYRNRRGGTSKISGTISGTIRAGVVIVATISRLFITSLARRLASSPLPPGRLDSEPLMAASRTCPEAPLELSRVNAAASFR